MTPAFCLGVRWKVAQSPGEVELDCCALQLDMRPVSAGRRCPQESEPRGPGREASRGTRGANKRVSVPGRQARESAAHGVSASDSVLDKVGSGRKVQWHILSDQKYFKAGTYNNMSTTFIPLSPWLAKTRH